jgi:hypothetical protein
MRSATYAQVVRDVGIASAREPEVRRDEGTGIVNMAFRGTSDARSSVDRDTRIRIALPPVQAARLWQLLGERLTDEEKRQAERADDG